MSKKSLAIAVVLLLLAIVSANQSVFSKWMTEHQRVYASGAEHQMRLNIFSANLAFVTQHNLEEEHGLLTFRVGMNRFADLTNDEYRTQFLSLHRNEIDTPSIEERQTVEFDAQMATPASWDWRNNGYTTPAKDQGQCGACWAFSATAAMEGAHFQATGTLLSLSEQMCVDCVAAGNDTCTVGGEMHDCYLQAIAQGGDALESVYPYSGTSGNKCAYVASDNVATFSSYLNVTQFNETALMIASSQAVISVGIDASSIYFQLYSSGVFSDTTCKTAWADLDHGVTVVGYNTDSTGVAYWIVRNSWGASWGLAGHIWMSRNANNQCGIATDATYPQV